MNAFYSRCAAAVIALLLCRSVSAQTWLSSGIHKIESQILEVGRELEQCPVIPSIQVTSNAGFHSGFAPRMDSARWVQVDLGEEYTIDSVVVVPASINGAGAYGFPNKFRIETSRDALLSEPELLVETTVEDPSSILPHFVTTGGRRARYVRFTALSLAPQPRLNSRFIFCLGELLVFSGGRNVALQGAVLAPNSVETLPTWSPKHLVDGSYALGIPALPIGSASNGWHSQIFQQPNTEVWVQVDLGGPRTLDEIRLIPAHPRDYPDRTGFGFPLRFKIETSLSENFSESSMVFDCRHADFANPGDTKVAFPLASHAARFIRMTAVKLWERSSDFVFALGELEAYEGRENIARAARVVASDSTNHVSWKPELLVDGIGGAGMLLDEETWLQGLSQRRLLLAKRELFTRWQIEEAKQVQTRTGGLSVGFVVLTFGVIGLLVLRGRALRRRELEILRQQISRDLHDDVGSNLCSIRLMAEMSGTTEDGRLPAEVLSEISLMAEAGTESLRDMVWLLKEGGQPKIGILVEKMRSVAGALLLNMDWSFRSEGVPAEVVAPLSFHRDLLFILREALHNVVKHAGAPSVDIQLRWTVAGVELSVADTGRGFDPNHPSGGDGIENMRYRAGQLRGTLLMERHPNGGTHLVVKIPKP